VSLIKGVSYHHYLQEKGLICFNLEVKALILLWHEVEGPQVIFSRMSIVVQLHYLLVLFRTEQVRRTRKRFYGVGVI
jgi:hypothetical protein